MTRNMEAEVASSPVVSCQVIPFGNPTCGSPLGTGPRTETPCDLKSKIQLKAMAPTTATSPPGTSLIHRSNTISVASTPSETASVAPDVWPTSFSVSQNLTSVPLSRSRSTLGDSTPSMPANWPSATWIPDSGEKADQHRPGDEVRQEPESRQPREEEEAGGEQSAEACDCQPLRGVRLEPRDPERCNPCEHDRGGCRVTADDEVPRRREDGEREDRNQDRVEARDDGRPGDLRVAHHLGNRQRRERHARDHVPRQPRPL